MATSYNEMAYGPIADSYANKYGIPTDVFRSFINERSGFDPFYTGTKGDGIAAVVNNSNNSAINVFDTGQQLDFAAQDLSKRYKDTNSWGTATKTANNGNAVPGIMDGSDTPGYDMMGNPTGVSQEDTETNKPTGEPSDQGMLVNIKNFLVKYAYSGIIFAVGLLLILATAYIVVIRGSGEK